MADHDSGGFAADSASLKDCQNFLSDLRFQVIAIPRLADPNGEQLEAVATEFSAAAARLAELFDDNQISAAAQETNTITKATRQQEYILTWLAFARDHFEEHLSNVHCQSILKSFKECNRLIELKLATLDTDIGDAPSTPPDVEATEDPFKQFRNEYNETRTFDSLSDEERAAIEQEWQEMREKVDLLTAENLPTGDDTAAHWASSLKTALTFEPTTWQLALDFAYSQKFDRFPDVQLNFDWTVGQHLLGLTSAHPATKKTTSFAAAFSKTVDAQGTEIVQQAVEEIIALLESNEQDILGTVGTSSVLQTKADTETGEHFVVMCKLLQEQKRETVLRNTVTTHLQRLGPALAELPETAKLLNFYQPKLSDQESPLARDLY
ncbi:hypothetical protein TI39_contig287g00007 [Zymoseptoria brevis]|uniref:Uncharacterized protein n=1 Tax=Zymoseptoria brevis TaxID=1047168 RepID=A0A0F4GVX2_9PEZI|nr:hypothetical protein TI39_contig287g00007 [Zymoseptoria brevis]